MSDGADDDFDGRDRLDVCGVVGEWEVKRVFQGNLFGKLDFEISTFPSSSFTLKMEKFPGAGMVCIAAEC